MVSVWQAHSHFMYSNGNGNKFTMFVICVTSHIHRHREWDNCFERIPSNQNHQHQRWPDNSLSAHQVFEPLIDISLLFAYICFLYSIWYRAAFFLFQFIFLFFQFCCCCDSFRFKFAWTYWNEVDFFLWQVGKSLLLCDIRVH